MRKLTASAAVCAMLAAAPGLAQDASQAADQDVYRSDLPETHAGYDLPQVDPAELEDGQAVPGSLIAGSTAAQQVGNLIAAKAASGVARDLGDAMILLHAGVLQRIAPVVQGVDIDVPQEARDAIARLESLNGQEANLAFARWVSDAYPRIIEGWQQMESAGDLGDLSQAVVPHLRQQLAVAEEIVAAGGDLPVVDSAAVERLQLGGPEGMAPGDEAEPAGEGQLSERQHTPEPEAPAVQTGENYAHEQVEVDPQSQTQAASEAAAAPAAAGELGSANAGGLFAAMSNPSVELEQLQAQDIGADRVRVVAVTDLLTRAGMESFTTTLSEVESSLSSVRDAAAATSAISDAVAKAGASPDDVVAIDVLDEGVVVYTYSG